MKAENLKIGQVQESMMVGERDAIHCAVICMEAWADLNPGQSVMMPEGVDTAKQKRVGVVDPFLTRPAKKGEFVWVFLNPGSITSLRHVWAHDQFPATECVNPKAEAKRWIENWAGSFGSNYDEVMMEAGFHVEKPDYYWIEGGRFEGFSVPAKFWECYEILKGKKPELKYGGQFFSCAC